MCLSYVGYLHLIFRLVVLLFITILLLNGFKEIFCAHSVLIRNTYKKNRAIHAGYHPIVVGSLSSAIRITALKRTIQLRSNM